MASTDSGEHPIYQAIAHDLRTQIQRRELAPGAQVPTEKQLAKRYEVSRNTVRMALNALTNEGLISAGRARAGRTVRRRDELAWTHQVENATSPTLRRRGLDAFVDQALRQGRDPSQTIEVVIASAESPVAERLEVAVGESLVVRRRLRRIDGVPSLLSESYYPLALVQGTAVLDPKEIVPSVMPLLTAIGHPQARYVDEVTTRMPGPDEALALDIGLGVPVLEHFRTGYSPHRPVRVTRTIMPGDRHRLRYELPA